MAETNPSNIRRLLAWIAFLAGAAIWFFPSDLVELIVRERPILLNRYSEDRFFTFLLLTLLLWIAAALLRSSVAFGRQLAFRVIAIGGTTVVTIFAVMIASFVLVSPRYVEQFAATLQGNDEVILEGIVRHRPPNQRFELTNIDRPEQRRSYPNPPEGYPPVPITMTIDPYGFRNPTPILDHYDILAVGDSYVAGSHVSDNQAWPYLLAGLSGKSVYNLGVSGSDPRVYLNNFVVHGVKFKPAVAIFMLYEGNDFKISPPPLVPGKMEAIGTFFRNSIRGSPVRRGMQQLSERYLEPLFAHRPVPEYERQMSWMPVALETAAGVRHYAFRPKRLLYLYHTEQQFENSAPWQGAKGVFQRIEETTARKGIRLIYVYAPSAPHVVLPLVKDRVPADQLHRFIAFVYKSLPPAEEFKQQVFDRLGAVEAVFRRYCEAEGIEFLSLTEMLQERTREGVQAYYTYDQHWTPPGNELVAQAIADYLKNHPTAP
jgi:hypothetical protein